MRAFFACLLIAGTPALVLAQAAQGAPRPAVVAAEPGAKPAAKAAVKRTPRIAASARKAVEEVTPVSDDPSIKLSEADMAMAKQVFMGSIQCELGASVNIAPMKRDGFFIVSTKGHRFRMHPVESRTGAIRLEDPQRGAMWLQLGNKSMLMSQKLGQRLADECQSPEQLTYADALKKNPIPSIFEPAAAPAPKASEPVLAVPAVPAAVPAAPASDGSAAPAAQETTVR